MARLARGFTACLGLALLSGCAPSFRLTAAPGCGFLQRGSDQRTSVMATTQRVHVLQARHSLSARYLAHNPNNWRAAATGECR